MASHPPSSGPPDPDGFWAYCNVNAGNSMWRQYAGGVNPDESVYLRCSYDRASAQNPGFKLRYDRPEFQNYDLNPTATIFVDGRYEASGVFNSGATSVVQNVRCEYYSSGVSRPCKILNYSIAQTHPPGPTQYWAGNTPWGEPPAPTSGIAAFWPWANEFGDCDGAVTPSVLMGLAHVESSYGVNLGPSSAGAEGPYQFIPSTWNSFKQDGDEDGDTDVYSIPDSAKGAKVYLDYLVRHKGSLNSALLAYNGASSPNGYDAKVLREAGLRASDPENTCTGGGPPGGVVDTRLENCGWLDIPCYLTALFVPLRSPSQRIEEAFATAETHYPHGPLIWATEGGLTIMANFELGMEEGDCTQNPAFVAQNGGTNIYFPVGEVRDPIIVHVPLNAWLCARAGDTAGEVVNSGGVFENVAPRVRSISTFLIVVGFLAMMFKLVMGAFGASVSWQNESQAQAAEMQRQIDRSRYS